MKGYGTDTFSVAAWITVGVAVVGTTMEMAMGAGTASRPVTVATVNGEPVTSQALEHQKVMRQRSHPDLSRADAYRQSMDHIIRHTVLLQEARRRGILVSHQEAKELLSKMDEMQTDAPEAAQFMEEQRRELGLGKAEYERELIRFFKEQLMIERLFAELHAESPSPSDEQVKEFSSREGGPNALVLLPIELADGALTRSLFEELRELQASLPAEEFVGTCDGYARGMDNLPPDKPIHQSFTFTRPNELPDYARAATDRAEGQMGLFEREDGSAVIYLVLKSVNADSEESLAKLKDELVQENQMSHAWEVQERLIREADVHFFESALSPEAKKALLDK